MLSTLLPTSLATLPDGDTLSQLPGPAPGLRGLAGGLSAHLCNVVPQGRALRLNISGVVTDSVSFGSCMEISGPAEGGAPV